MIKKILEKGSYELLNNTIQKILKKGYYNRSQNNKVLTKFINSKNEQKEKTFYENIAYLLATFGIYQQGLPFNSTESLETFISLYLYTQLQQTIENEMKILEELKENLEMQLKKITNGDERLNLKNLKQTKKEPIESQLKDIKQKLNLLKNKLDIINLEKEIIQLEIKKDKLSTEREKLPLSRQIKKLKEQLEVLKALSSINNLNNG